MERSYHETRTSADGHSSQEGLRQDLKSQKPLPGRSQQHPSQPFDTSPQTAYRYEDTQTGPEPRVGDLPYRGTNTAVRRKPVPNFSRNHRRSAQSTGSSPEEDLYYDCQPGDVQSRAAPRELTSTTDDADPRARHLNQPQHNQNDPNTIFPPHEEGAHSTLGPTHRSSPLPVPNRGSSKIHEPSRDARGEYMPKNDAPSADTATHTPITNQQRGPHDTKIAPTPGNAEKWLNDLSAQFSRTSVHQRSSEETDLRHTEQHQAHHPAGPRQMPSHKAKVHADEGWHTESSEPAHTTVSQQRQAPPTGSGSTLTADEVLERSKTNTAVTTYHETHLPRMVPFQRVKA